MKTNLEINNSKIYFNISESFILFVFKESEYKEGMGQRKKKLLQIFPDEKINK